MNILTGIFGKRGSLRLALIVNILVVITICIGLAGSILTAEFFEHLEENMQTALLQEARELAGLMDPNAPAFGLASDTIRFTGDTAAFRYSILNPAGVPLVGGETFAGLADIVAGLTHGQSVAVESGDDRAARALIVDHGDASYVVLVSAPHDPSNTLAEFFHEVLEETQWVFVGILGIVFAAVMTARNGLKPVEKLLRETRDIGPHSIDKRLSPSGLPAELVPLVDAVNAAFDRLEQGYRAQRDFSANVAHEVRTPLAVLRSSIDRIPDDGLRQSMRNDISGLEQVFEQLIDLSRAEALGVAMFAKVDLKEIAADLATRVAVPALREGKRLAISGANAVEVQGHAGLLSIALGNLVQNAVKYAPEGTEVEIEVTANPAGWRVLDRGTGISGEDREKLFERFRRGATAGRSGAGLGLAIVKSVADAHGATVAVEDRIGGGSVFSFRFPDL